ncbi:unnamed protein product [Closterium sp. NIES-64]|nr:unnamed protein product [Closterium sp. NIES-64]
MPFFSRVCSRFVNLSGTTRDLQQRVAAGETLESVLLEAFAVVREASKRVLGLRPFDVQLIGGMVLHDGQIAEMRTGEGKTLVAVLPAYLNALTGKGVHVVTVNDYLARRDAEWVGQIHKYLGLSVGLIQQGMTAQQRRESYACDVTYVTNSELGFDYLRDNLATSKVDLVVPTFNFCIIDEVDSILIDKALALTPLHPFPSLPALPCFPHSQSKMDLVVPSFNFCIIDEVDSILIDEARTPLIISGPAEKPSERYLVAAKIAAAFERDVHYTVDEKQKVVLLAEAGYDGAGKVSQEQSSEEGSEGESGKEKASHGKQQRMILRQGAVVAVKPLPACTLSLPMSARPTQVDEKQKVVLLTEIGYEEAELVLKVDEKQKVVLLTEIGYEEAELVLKVTDLYDPKEQWASFLLNAIKAKELFTKDVQYIVRDGAVLIVDEFTGRIMEGRRWSEGVHQAVEAKEGVAIQNETVGLCGVSEGVHQAVEAKEGVVPRTSSCRWAKMMEGRRWGEGVHQAVEAKEGVAIQNETYPKLCGMTGTAATEADEFGGIYKLAVAEVPTNRPLQRKDEQDVVYRTSVGKWRAVVADVKGRHAEEQPVLVDEQDVVYRTSVGKWKAVVADVKGRHAEGRPVLVGTTSVEISEALSAKLKEANVPHQVLNAKPENVEREAEIVAQSGRVGAVTIATNMAGRGTDILLGGNAEFMARLKLREALMPRVVKADDVAFIFQGKTKIAVKRTWTVPPSLFPCPLLPDLTDAVNEAVQAAVEAWGSSSLTALEAEDRLAFACEKGPTSDPVVKQLRAAFEAVEGEYRRFTEEEKRKVIAAGGLHVIGTERHESRRVDNQLRGRSGRQGDPGSSRFFLSLEDNLLRVFGGERIDGLMRAFHVEDLPIESPFLNRALEDAQRKVENYYFDIRKQLFEYDQVLNSQRERFYSERRRALETEDLEGLMLEYAQLTMDDIVNANIDPSLSQEEWNFEALTKKVKQYCALLTDLSIDDIIYHSDTVDTLRDYLHQRSKDAYYTKKAEVESAVPGLMRDAERYFVLTQMDLLWKEHLQALRFTQQAVALRGYAQRDPLIEYKLEGYNLFLAMMGQIRRNVIYSVYQFNPVTVTQPDGGQPSGSS